MLKVKKAIIPVAGLGTRFLPVTKAVPKELLPIIDTPMIEYIVREAVSSGIEEIVFVTSKDKSVIEKYFSRDNALESHLTEKGKDSLAALVKEKGTLCKVIPVEQPEPLGLGHAVLMAKDAIGNQPFALLLPDEIIDADVPCIGQLMSIYEKSQQSVVAIMEVPKEDVKKYGIISGQTLSEKEIKIDRVVEKPNPQNAPSQWALPGRYVLDSKVFEYLENTEPGKNGEIQLTDGLERLAENEGLIGYAFTGSRYDTGDKLGYLEAILHFGLKSAEFKTELEKLVAKAHNGTI